MRFAFTTVSLFGPVAAPVWAQTADRAATPDTVPAPGTAAPAPSATAGASPAAAASATSATSATSASAASAADGTAVTALPTVTVTAQAPSRGTLRTDTATVGPLGALDRLDTPYTINVVPQRLIQDQQLKSIADALRYLPSVQGDGTRPQTRGIQGSVVQNSRLDGLNAVSTTDYPLEQFDRIEVMNGLAGALYGPANPAGTFNYIQKRPTDERLTRFTFGFTSQTRFLREADLSDRVGPSRAIGYRLTLLDETGTGYADHSTIRRQLGSLALDFHLSPDTVVETNFSHYHYVAKGLSTTFALGSGVHYPAALDPTSSAYGSSDGGANNTTETGSIRIRHDFSPNWHVSAAILRQIADRESTTPTDTLTNNAGRYTSTIATATASRFTITSNLVTLNGTVDTGPLRHAITLGTSGFTWNNYNPVAGATTTLGTASLANPQAFALTGVPDFTHRYQSAQSAQQSLIAGDDITFSPQWSALLVGSQSWLSTHNYNTKSVQTSESANQGLSGAASLIFKPRRNMSVYVTYADSLQQGDTAPTGSTNVGNILDPYRSKQWEVGYKVAVAGVNASLAAFRITRPYAYTQADGVYAVAGEQRNRGIELMLDGEATRDLSLFGGVTWLDPRLYNTATTATAGKRIVGLPVFAMNFLAEYKVPQVPGLFTTFNTHFVGARPTDNTNTYSVSSYTTFDLGAGYLTSMFNRAVTFRLALDNLTNRRYWTNIVPGALTGYTGAGNATAQLGAPRTVQASVQFEL
ncbi:TonB-dependent siderophore receptor [Robbsia sp. Bb-Pol-6]|uniref:TonB-dependent siderophore receptor n=1 Tax=Robbsia betulipollinis TaxID=2981849 RepID=A0ABT3ZRV0_9BURK|nr:TonB-dependent siderophore receptor [Robbsia betulipollinis]MCY0389281.1 TonB-dependent siderophore receptor [Robbsia betulipollinis]